MLYIYGTIFNNHDIVLRSLESIKELPYQKIIVTDNYSTDGTYELLVENKDKYNLCIIRHKCNRGIGRQMAMEEALKESSKNDYLMSVDFDTIYGSDFIKFVSSVIISPVENTIYNNFLSLHEANEAVPWRNLNNGEDWERMAHFGSLGFQIKIGDFEVNNQRVIGSRDKRYANGLKYYIRVFRNTVDLQVSWCFKSYSEFYEHVKKRKLIVFLAYILSKFFKNYCYDAKLNNRDFVKKLNKKI
jgi:glycosyltransferase involved in cell wall biosynthesis